IHNGADDNASGSSGVAELAEYFVKNPLRRPILFMTFSAEERGLLGSADFVKNGPLATENMYVMLNCDMIGRSRGYLFVGGLGTALELNETLEDLLDGKRLGLELELSQSGEAPSDNTSFYRADVPALFFFTNIHDDYHMPGDDADKIDYAGEVKVLELIRDIAGSLDQRDDRLTFQTAPGMGMPADFNDRMMSQYGKIAERAKNRGRLGINADSSEGGLLIIRVREESAAARAGLQVGDVLVSLSGRATTDKEQLRRAMGGKLKGEVVTAVYLHAGNEHNIEITLQ
ncbi:MAG: M28 family peptidase, partial [Planctomycetes bacterium]|nr:M28 family peptidase [Planctomycetota bacterium]